MGGEHVANLGRQIDAFGLLGLRQAEDGLVVARRLQRLGDGDAAYEHVDVLPTEGVQFAGSQGRVRRDIDQRAEAAVNRVGERLNLAWHEEEHLARLVLGQPPDAVARVGHDHAALDSLTHDAR
jgi:hypothetical protein